MNKGDFIIEEVVPDDAQIPYIRRILVGFSTKPIVTQLPIAATGFAYLTYTQTEGQVSIRYSDRTLQMCCPLNLVNQLQNEMPTLSMRGKVEHIGVELLPSLPFRLFGISGMDLLNDYRRFDQVDATAYAMLLREIRKQDTPVKKGEVLKQFIDHRLGDADDKAKDIERSLQLIYNNNGVVSVPELAKGIHMNERTFRRRFKQVIGLAPKYYAKVIQLNHVFHAIKSNNENSVYQLALESGYYDHSHFINDFQRFVGSSPGAFLSSKDSFLRTYLGKIER